MKAYRFFLFPLLVSFAACTKKPAQEVKAEEKALVFEDALTAGWQVGLKPMEVALTLDDGPVPESLEIAKKLRDLEVPVTYFFIGINIQSFPQITKEIAELKFTSGPLKGQPATIIANHSWDHKRKNNGVACIACDGTEYAEMEIKKTDDLIAGYVNSANKPFFFRAPGGNFFRRNVPSEVSSLAELNKTLNKYIGPFFWDVSGDVEEVCNGLSAAKCGDVYMSQIRAKGQRQGIIILAHEIHEKTRQMLIGNDSYPGIVNIMKREGYNFVSLDKYPDALSKFGPVPGNEFGEIKFDVNQGDGRTFKIDVNVKDAARVEVFIDRLQRPFFTGDGPQISSQQTISSGGQRVFQIKGYDKENKLVALGRRVVAIPF
jgi:peptidoglycan/xylan/chitin deacetylase (PgdA/CDA1 family)